MWVNRKRLFQPMFRLTGSYFCNNVKMETLYFELKQHEKGNT